MTTLKDIIEVSWVKSLLYNFMNLPFHQARHLPVLLYHPHMDLRAFLRFGNGGGRIKLATRQVSFGMIKMGKKSQSTCTSKGLWLSNQGEIIFKGSALIGNGCKLEVKKGARLEIGRNTGITGDAVICCYKNVSLGNFFSCAWNVSICDTDFHECYDMTNDVKMPSKMTLPINIGEYVWVCQNVTILKGSCIPDWCTVGANALVKNDFSKADRFSLIAGIPAKVTTGRIQRTDLHELENKTDFQITKGVKVFG